MKNITKILCGVIMALMCFSFIACSNNRNIETEDSIITIESEETDTSINETFDTTETAMTTTTLLSTYATTTTSQTTSAVDTTTTCPTTTLFSTSMSEVKSTEVKNNVVSRNDSVIRTKATKPETFEDIAQENKILKESSVLVETSNTETTTTTTETIIEGTSSIEETSSEAFLETETQELEIETETETKENQYTKTYVKHFSRGTYYAYGCQKNGGSGRKLIDCSYGDGFVKGSIASSYLYRNYGYKYNGKRTMVYLEISGYPEMNGYYYVDDSDAGNPNVIDFYYIYGSNCPFRNQGVVQVECYIVSY